MIWRVVVIGLILGLGVLFLFGLQNDPRKIPSPLVGKAAPVFSAETISGKPFSSESLKGKVTLVTFWASWCTTCKADEPLIDALRARFSERDDFVVLGIGTQDTRDNLAGHLKKGNRKYVNLFDEKGELAIDFGVYGVPETYLLSQEGVIVEKMVGPINPRKLSAKIVELFAGGKAG